MLRLVNTIMLSLVNKSVTIYEIIVKEYEIPAAHQGTLSLQEKEENFSLDHLFVLLQKPQQLSQPELFQALFH